MAFCGKNLHNRSIIARRIKLLGRKWIPQPTMKACVALKIIMNQSFDLEKHLRGSESWQGALRDLRIQTDKGIFY